MVLERQTSRATPVKLTEKVPFRLACLAEVCTGSKSPEPTLSDAVRGAFVRIQEKLKQHQFQGHGSHDDCRTVLTELRKKFPENFAQVSYDLYRQILADKDAVFLPETVVRRQWCHTVWNAFFDANGLDAVLTTLPFLRNEVAGTDAYTLERVVWNNDSPAGEPVPRCYAEYFYWPHFSILAQLPSINVPCGSVEVPDVSPSRCSEEALQALVTMPGRSRDNPDSKLCKVPIGFQLVGRPHADAQLVAMAEEIKRVAEL